MPALYKKMNDCYYFPSVYAQKWFITLFAAYFPLKLVARIWDIYLVEGRKTIFRVALAIMKLNEDELMRADQCRLFTIFDDYKGKVNSDQLLAMAFKSFTFSHKLIDELDKEYSNKPKDDIYQITN